MNLHLYVADIVWVCHLQEVSGLEGTDAVYLCLTWILNMFQPHIGRPLPPVSSGLWVCPDQSPMLLSTQLTHLLQAIHRPPPTTFRMQRQVLRQRTAFFAACAHQPFQLCWLCGGPFSPLPGEGNGYPLQYSCLENPMDRGAWQATVHGVTKSQA